MSETLLLMELGLASCIEFRHSVFQAAQLRFQGAEILLAVETMFRPNTTVPFMVTLHWG